MLGMMTINRDMTWTQEYCGPNAFHFVHPNRQWPISNAVCVCGTALIVFAIGYVPFHFSYIGERATKSCDFRWSHSSNRLNSHGLERFQPPRALSSLPPHFKCTAINNKRIFSRLRRVSHDSWCRQWDNNNFAPKWTAWDRKHVAVMHSYDGNWLEQK